MKLALEFKRGKTNYSILLFLILNLMAVALGGLLMFSIDKVAIEEITQKLLTYSTYTVYTQFGLFFFSPFIINCITSDYKSKNILFYKFIRINAFLYFLQKLLFLFVLSIIGVFFGALVIFFIYNDLWFSTVFFSKTIFVMFWYCTILLLLSFVFGKFLIVFFISVILWLIGILLSQISSKFQYLAYFDAANPDYKRFMELLDNKIAKPELGTIILENSLVIIYVFFIAIIAVFIFRKRWAKNGI